MNNVNQLRICVEKPLDEEKHVLHSLRQNSNSEYHYNRLRAAFYTQKLWPKNSEITISFLKSDPQETASWTPLAVMQARREPDGSPAKLDPIESEIRDLTFQEAIKKIVKERFEPFCGLKFTFLSSSQGHGKVRIGFDSGGGSWSLVGTDCLKSNKKTMNFAWMDGATVMHEFGHLLGMIHEHQNPKANPIEWNIPVVDEWAKKTQGWSKEVTYKNIIQRYKTTQLNASNFDPKSIMLYFFPAKMTTNGKGTNINLKLSPVDVEYIHKLYPGGEMSPEQFYKQAYGVSIHGNKTKEILLIILGLFLALGILVLIMYLYQKKR